MPWQQNTLDVGLEYDPETGIPFYREVDITVPRQQGKTTDLLVVKCHRAVTWAARVKRPQRIVYTAQTGNDARKKLLEDEVPILMGSPFRAAVEQVRRVNGSEGILFRGGSRIDVLASSASAGHGRTVDLGQIDEAFDDADDRREQAIIPAMSTRADGQLWVASTMGTDAAIYLNRKVDAGRDAVVSGRDSGICYIEYSAPEDADIDDPDVWKACMPAFGCTIGPAAVKHARATMTEGEFRRAYLNQMTRADDRIIPEAAWDAVNYPDVRPDGKMVFGIDCNPERTSGAIAACDTDGRIELVAHESGTGWITGKAVELAKKWRAPVSVDLAGPAGTFAADIQRADVEIMDVTGRTFAHACSGFYDAVADQTIKIRRHVALDVAAASARKRISGDAWTWARRDTRSDISPLVAVTVGHWAALNLLSAPVFAY